MKKVVNFTVEEDIWARCQKLKKKLKMKINWSALVEEFLTDCLKEYENYDKDFVEILEKPTVNLSDIKKVRALAITKLGEGIEQETKKFSDHVDMVLEEINDVLQHLDKREVEIMSSEEKEIKKPKTNP